MNMKIKNTTAVALIGLGIISGIAGTVAMQVRAADTTTTPAVTTSAPTTDTTAATQSPETTEANPTATDTTKPKGHAPLGGDGNITAINGTSITMQEETDEGGASYTVDASKVGDITKLKVGDKVFVKGTTDGTNVAATSISLGHPNGKCTNPKEASTSAGK